MSNTAAADSKESRRAERSRPLHQDHAGLHMDAFQHKIILVSAPPTELKEGNKVSAVELTSDRKQILSIFCAKRAELD